MHAKCGRGAAETCALAAPTRTSLRTPVQRAHGHAAEPQERIRCRYNKDQLNGQAGIVAHGSGGTPTGKQTNRKHPHARMRSIPIQQAAIHNQLTNCRAKQQQTLKQAALGGREHIYIHMYIHTNIHVLYTCIYICRRPYRVPCTGSPLTSEVAAFGRLQGACCLFPIIHPAQCAKQKRIQDKMLTFGPIGHNTSMNISVTGPSMSIYT